MYVHARYICAWCMHASCYAWHKLHKCARMHAYKLCMRTQVILCMHAYKPYERIQAIYVRACMYDMYMYTCGYRHNALQNQFHYYRLCFFTTEAVPLLRSRFLYHRVNFFTTESVSSLQSQFLYYTINFVATRSVSFLQNKFYISRCLHACMYVCVCIHAYTGIMHNVCKYPMHVVYMRAHIHIYIYIYIY